MRRRQQTDGGVRDRSRWVGRGQMTSAKDFAVDVTLVSARLTVCSAYGPPQKNGPSIPTHSLRMCVSMCVCAWMTQWHNYLTTTHTFQFTGIDPRVESHHKLRSGRFHVLPLMRAEKGSESVRLKTETTFTKHPPPRGVARRCKLPSTRCLFVVFQARRETR